MGLFCRAALAGVLCLPAFSQDIVSSAAATPGATTPVSAPIDKRAYGVLPNYRTANLADPYTPLTTKRKLTIASKDSFDYPIFGLAGFFSAEAQLMNTHPDFGQGVKGYAHRYGTAFVDQMVGNYMTEGLYPALLHEDPRYFRVGASYGGAGKRLLYAASRVLVAKNDKGHWTFNAAEVAGNFTASGIANLYYPQERGLSDNVERATTQIGTDAISNILKEFWPDIKQKYFSHRGKRRD
jgi:hypothetical protein